LANYFLERLSFDLGLTRVELSGGAISVLQSYPWPGNIRELRNALERAILLSGNRILTEHDLNFDMTPEPEENAGYARTLEQVERQYIEEVLQRENGRVDAAAKTLGIPRSSLYQKIKEFNIPRPGAASHSPAAERRPH
jgi:DNA-binding NtrC family response regulator